MRFIEPLQRMFPRAFDGGINHRKLPSLQGKDSGNVAADRILNALTKPVEFRFKEFRLGTGYFKVWSSGVGKLEVLGKYLRDLSAETIGNEDVEAILCEAMQKTGFSLTESVHKIELEGAEVFSANDGALLVSLDPKLQLNVIRAMIASGPEMILFLED